MSSFYTNVQSIGGTILYRGIQNGKKIKTRVEYAPSLFFPSKRITNFTNLEGDYLEEKKLVSIKAAREYIKQFEGVSGAPKIYGQTRFEYAFIADQHQGMVDYDYEKVSIAVIDIEVGSENGFPDPYEANEPITAICLKFLNGRFRKILGDDEAKKLSPWNYITERKAYVNNRQLIDYTLVGVSSLDYIELYKWYAPGGKSQESYRLDNIAQVELGEGKIAYEEYDNLHTLYRLNYQKFIEYNIKDVELIIKLEDKLKLLELAVTLAYDTKSNFEDVFAQTRMWDALTYSYLRDKDIIVPPRVIKDKDAAFEGAYVKVPQVGLHDWVASFDLNSLYPHLMMQYNISPETLIEPENYTNEMRGVLEQGVSVDRLLKKRIDTTKLENATLTPNGQFFRTDIQGFLPKMMEEMYTDRSKFKKMMLAAKQEYENEKDPSKLYEIEKRIAKYNNIQLAKKVSLNSAYGALGSQYFRFYDLRMALGVTTAGQLSIRWIENKINEWMNKILDTKDVDYVIASDTDSIYLRMGELVNKFVKDTTDKQKVITLMDKICEEKIQPYIDKSYQELAEYVHAYQQKMEMKREGLSNKGIWTAKKRYILNIYNNEGVQYKEPQMKVMGLEMIKSSTPSAIREKMKQAIQLMVSGTENDIHKFIEDFRKEFKTLPVEEISFPRGLNGLNTYSDDLTLYKKGTPIHVKGAILYNHNLKQKNLTKKYPLIQEGEKVKFTYLKMPNPFKDTVISYPSRLPKEFELQEYIDYDMQYDKAFLDPIRVILDCMGWKTEKTSSIEDFFS